MDKTLMLIVGTILGIAIGYVTFSTKPEYIIQAEGFGKLNFSRKEKKFDIEILERIDADNLNSCLLYTSPSPRDATLSRMPSSA